MRLQRIPHDTTKYRNNPVELLDISKRSRIGSEYALTANTKLLITGIGENDSTTILDSTGKTVTRYGDTKISTTQSIIGPSSIYFDGTGDYLSLTDSADWDFSTGDFTVDFWVRFGSTTSANIIAKRTSGILNWFVIQWASSSISLYATTNGVTWDFASLTIASNLSINTWYHIAVVRNVNVLNTFLNGTIEATGNVTGKSLLSNASTMQIGYDYTYPLNGYLSYLRVTKGQALWTSNFTPPKFISDNYIGA